MIVRKDALYLGSSLKLAIVLTSACCCCGNWNVRIVCRKYSLVLKIGIVFLHHNIRPSATAPRRVSWTVYNLLFRKILQVSVCDLVGTFDCSGHRECVAWTTISLVLYQVNCTISSPVKGSSVVRIYSVRNCICWSWYRAESWLGDGRAASWFWSYLWTPAFLASNGSLIVLFKLQKTHVRNKLHKLGIRPIAELSVTKFVVVCGVGIRMCSDDLILGVNSLSYCELVPGVHLLSKLAHVSYEIVFLIFWWLRFCHSVDQTKNSNASFQHTKLNWLNSLTI